MRFLFFFLLLLTSCYHTKQQDPLALIQIQDRNGLTETVSNPERLPQFEALDFFSPQPYKKVLRIYKKEGKNYSRITTYHPNGVICQYLEGEEMRAKGAYREWFPNGQIKLEATLSGGTADLVAGIQEDWVFDGESNVWDEDGNLIAVIPYQRGALEGTSLYYYPSGVLERQLDFVKNSLEGEELQFWPDGTLKQKILYHKGQKQGESFSFFKNGSLACKENYSEGRLKNAEYYNLEGKCISKIENGGGFQALFEDGALSLIEFKIGIPEGLVQKFTKDNEIQRSYFIKNGKKQGEEIEYFRKEELEVPLGKPQPKLSLHWNENRIHGSVKTWYPNGQLQSQKEFSQNQRTGPSLAWYEDGSLMLYEEYEENRLVSGKYYKIQKNEAISSIVNGNGVATLYDRSGVFLRKIPYFRGKIVDSEE